MPRIAVVLLVDPRGHVLLQHRDEHAPRAANQWGMVGGHVEPGEDFDLAVHREILEETGIVTGPDDLVLWQETEFSYSDGHRSSYRVYAGRVDLTDDDIVLGEGRAIVFVDPAETAALDKAESLRPFPAAVPGLRHLPTAPRREDPVSTSTLPTTRHPHPSPAPHRGARDGRRGRGDRRPRQRLDRHRRTAASSGSRRRDRCVRVGNTGGRPLGIELYGEDRLLIADAQQGC